MGKIRSLILSLAVGESAIGAQSLQPDAATWTQFRAPDSSFAVMIPSGRPFEVRSKDSGYVSETVYFNAAGPTSLEVLVQSHRAGASIYHMPGSDTFCVPCLGRVASDTTIDVGPRAGRWMLVDSGSGDSKGTATSMYRLVLRGTRLYVVSARMPFGQSLASDAGWFLQSFRLCAITDPCPTIEDGPPPWHASPFRYLPPAGVGSGEVNMGTLNLGQLFFDYQVDRPAVTAPGSPAPTYPPALKVRGVEGEVVAAFVVDTTGLAEVTSLKILKSTDPLFTEAVESALPHMRFIPAVVGREKVRQLVQHPFVFSLPH